MARPCKSVNLMSKNLTKEEIEIRSNVEKKLKGSTKKLSPPKNLTKAQKKIFNAIVDMLKESEVLGSPDVYILTICSRAIDRLDYIETKIDADINLLSSKELMSSKEKYSKDFFRCCNELSLSPQSRSKMANIALQAKQQDDDPVLKALRGG